MWKVYHHEDHDNEMLFMPPVPPVMWWSTRGAQKKTPCIQNYCRHATLKKKLPSKMRNMDSRHLDGFFHVKFAVKRRDLWHLADFVGDRPLFASRLETDAFWKSQQVQQFAGNSVLKPWRNQPCWTSCGSQTGIFWTSLPCFDVLLVDQSEAMKSILPNSSAAAPQFNEVLFCFQH